MSITHSFLTLDATVAVATNTLRSMQRIEDAEAYFEAICDAGVASAVHYGARCAGHESTPFNDGNTVFILVHCSRSHAG